jgi:putative phage-type endonuclease
MEFILETKDEWVKSRAKGIGGSEVAAVLGLDPYRSPYSVWVEKSKGESRNIDNLYTRAGTKLEPIVVEYFKEETDFVIEEQNADDFHQVTHPDYEYMRGSRDRIYIKPNGERCILECKTTQSTIDKNDLPVTWYCQLQWYMGLYNIENGSIAWLERGLRFDYIELPLDRNFFNYLVEKVREFWEDYVVTNTEPPYLHLHDIESKYPLHTDNAVIEASNELYESYNKLKELREKKKELEVQEDELIAQFKMTMKDSERAMYNGAVLATWRSDKPKMVFDAVRFQAENPDVVSKYMIEKSGTRRFLIK